MEQFHTGGVEHENKVLGVKIDHQSVSDPCNRVFSLGKSAIEKHVPENSNQVKKLKFEGMGGMEEGEKREKGEMGLAFN